MDHFGAKPCKALKIFFARESSIYALFQSIAKLCKSLQISSLELEDRYSIQLSYGRFTEDDCCLLQGLPCEASGLFQR
jgi:hypothetical protein